MSDEWDGCQACEELLEIVLKGVENQNMRRMLEHLVRRGLVQRACIIKEMYLKHQ